MYVQICGDNPVARTLSYGRIFPDQGTVVLSTRDILMFSSNECILWGEQNG